MEGDRLANAFSWKDTLAPRFSADIRSGHWNGVWAYWSDDGLGILEYLQVRNQRDDGGRNTIA